MKKREAFKKAPLPTGALELYSEARLVYQRAARRLWLAREEHERCHDYCSDHDDGWELLALAEEHLALEQEKHDRALRELNEAEERWCAKRGT